jgi:hypothetical protein
MSELEERFLTVVDIVDNLYKFSRMVRAPALQARFLKAASYKKIDQGSGIDLMVHLKSSDYAYVKEVFLSCRRENDILDAEINTEDADLIKRIANAITKRRQMFLYWKRHRDKLGVHAHTQDFEVSTIIPPATAAFEQIAPNIQATTLPPPDTKFDRRTIVNLPVAESSASKTELTGTTATMFILTDNASDAGQTTTSFATTARGLDGTKVELPGLPKSAIPGKDFECQYCFAIVPSHYQSPRGWR